MHFIIACGGTGGHLYPGLATAEALRTAGHTVALWISGKPIEKKALKDWTGPVEGIPTDWEQSLTPKTLFTLLRALFRCLRLLLQERPAALLAMGSRASIIPVLAARLMRIPVVLHESNVLPGQAVQLLSRHCRCTVALGFADTAPRLPGRTTAATGFPLRDLTPQGPLPNLPPGPDPVVLVMGGSQGSTRVNALACDALIRLRQRNVLLRVVHLAGSQQEAAIRQSYEAAGVPAVVFGYLHDMGAAYSVAAVAVSRAGAASCAELAQFGVPTLYIPYPYAGNHQRLNALAMEKAGAAVLRAQDSLTIDGLADRLEQFLRNPAELDAMREAALKAATPDAARRLADLLIQTSGRAPA